MEIKSLNLKEATKSLIKELDTRGIKYIGTNYSVKNIGGAVYIYHNDSDGDSYWNIAIFFKKEKHLLLFDEVIDEVKEEFY